MNTLDQNRVTALAFIEALGRGDVSAVEKLITDDVLAICTGTSVVSGSRDYVQICDAVRMLGSAVRNGIAFTPISSTAQENRVSCEFEGRSTLVNGVEYNNQYHFLFTLRDGKICRMKEYMDTKLTDATLGTLMQQGA